MEDRQGSVLDQEYLARLGQFDIVYSWGVLHHTGSMWQVMENVKPLIKPGGRLFIAIYNDCGEVSRSWLGASTDITPCPVRCAGHMRRVSGSRTSSDYLTAMCAPERWGLIC